MQTISEIINAYSGSIDHLDIEILIANSLSKTREFILTHPEQTITEDQESMIIKLLKRRMRGEPIAYILGHKEFHGLDFEVNKYTLIPRPETEMMVEDVLDLLRSLLRSKLRNIAVVDIGTGSGCIITSIAKNDPCHLPLATCHYCGIDISKEALKIAKKNAKKHDLGKKIKFFHGNLLEPILKSSVIISNQSSVIITANLPYLSKDIYDSAPVDVKKYEPKSALYSAKQGLAHYEDLLNQLKKMMVTGHWSLVTVFLEISPEQKLPIQKLIKSIFPKAEIEFKKDLAGKWRICKIDLNK